METQRHFTVRFSAERRWLLPPSAAKNASDWSPPDWLVPASPPPPPPLLHSHIPSSCRGLGSPRGRKAERFVGRAAPGADRWASPPLRLSGVATPDRTNYRHSAGRRRSSARSCSRRQNRREPPLGSNTRVGEKRTKRASNSTFTQQICCGNECCYTFLFLRFLSLC